MKFIAALYLIVSLAVTGFVGYIAIRFDDAAEAMEKASRDFRDQAQTYEAERMRIASALSQIERDIIRIRELKRKGNGR